jgi:murein DD-endopeptidase MepM/ murein hydrolase activator NlpD
VTTWPIQGSIVTAFSPDALVANETMGDWRTHEGIDLAALAGTNVQAVADGTVTSIDTDLLLGTVMTVSHEGGLTSIYGNLDAETLVEVGDKVSAGCVLGQVGLTAAGETATGDHLHFAMELNGENVNPKDYLP